MSRQEMYFYFIFIFLIGGDRRENSLKVKSHVTRNQVKNSLMECGMYVAATCEGRFGGVWEWDVWPAEAALDWILSFISTAIM